MKIKYKTSKWLITCLILFMAFSCENDFLDRQPLASVSSTTFMSSKAEVETGLIGVYSRLQLNFLGYVRPYLDCISDNAWLGNTAWLHRRVNEILTQPLTPSMTGTINQLYEEPYKLINSCNFFIENTSADKAEDVTVEEMEIYKAEARFLRALAYFDLVQLWGDVVLYKSTPETIDGWFLPRSPKEEVYAFIEEDLNYAISKLPNTLYSGHAVKGSAQGLLGRVLLTQEKWSEAAAVLNDVITSGPFSLSNDYAAIFREDGQMNPSVSCEIMFSTMYLGADDPQWAKNQMGLNLEVGAWGFVQPHMDLIDSYQMIDGLPASESELFDNTDSLTRYQNRDPRLDLTVLLPAETWIDGQGEPISRANIQNVNDGGVLMEKYIELSKAPFTKAGFADNDQDMVWLRYADVLLMYAEAKNEASGPDASVYNAINQVRARPGINMPPVDQTRYNSKDLLRQYIRDERRVEFGFGRSSLIRPETLENCAY